MTHTSVLLHECIESLALKEGMTVVDGTFGAGGHSRRIAEVIGKKGQLIAFDADKSVFSEAKQNALLTLTRFVPVAENFRNIDEVLGRLSISGIDAALFDLGLSSTQLEVSGRGFSFQRNEPLTMTFVEKPKEGETTAGEIVNHWSEESIATILKGFGEERFAGRIARGIVETRKKSPITSTSELVEIIRSYIPARFQKGKTHFATQTFQALRMAVNDELGVITAGIEGALTHMTTGGRIAVISFHSVEDRVVKQLFRRLADEGTVLAITKKPIVPTESEIKANPRSRSAKLRVVQKI
jgi:16S rRNA (cytosine1402-N4)-methyltransferase